MTKRKTPTTSTLNRATTTAPKLVRVEASVIDQDAVARRAYERFIERGSQHGNDLEDWLAAEAEVRSRAGH